jgi:CBS domain containing-hemolysin-like protein
MLYIELAIVVALILINGLLGLAELAIVSSAALDCRHS